MLLGTPDGESTDVFAATVRDGDPSWMGPLAGVALGLAVYHIVEPEVRDQFPVDAYRDTIAPYEPYLEPQAIIEAVRNVRGESQA